MRNSSSDERPDMPARVRDAVLRAVEATRPVYLVDLCEELAAEGPDAWRLAAAAAADQCALQLGIRAPQPGAGIVYEAALPAGVRQSPGQYTGHRMLSAYMEAGPEEAARVLAEADDETAAAAAVALLVVVTAGAGYDPEHGDDLTRQMWGPVEEREREDTPEDDEGEQRFLHAQAPGVVTLGWDARLSTFYGYVEDPNAEDDEGAYPLWVGGYPFALRSVEELAEAIPYPIEERFRERLEAARKRKGEKFGTGPLDHVVYETNRGLPEVTPAQVEAMEEALRAQGRL